MKLKVSMVIMSHLSDLQALLNHTDNHYLSITRINFVKFLILKFPDTSVEIDAEEQWKEFGKKHPHLIVNS